MQHVIVTGATGAIGAEICSALAQKGYGIILACRDFEKADALSRRLPKETRATFLRLDLADRDAVHTAAAELPRLIPPADTIIGLINNAGIMSPRYIASPQGDEIDMTVNCINTSLWARLLLQSGLLGSGTSIVFTTSLTRHLFHGETPPPQPAPRKFSRLRAYGASKRALTLYATQLADALRPHGIAVNCADPGVVDSGMITMHKWFDPLTDILFRPFIRSPRKGAIPALRAFEAGLRGDTGNIYCLRAIHPLPPAKSTDPTAP